MLLSELKTIDIYAKEWRDKINGNSYFSSRVVLNLDYENELIIEIPFQYGYEEAYLYESMDAVKHLFPASKWYKESLQKWQAKDLYKFKLNYGIIKDCRKKDLYHGDGLNYMGCFHIPIPNKKHKQWSKS